MRGDALAAFGRIRGLNALRQRLGVARSAQSQCLVASQERLDGASQPGPELDLAGDGTFGDFTGQSGIEHQAIGELHGLAHGEKVAKRYRVSMAASPGPESMLHLWFEAISVRENHATRVKITQAPTGKMSAATQTVGISLLADWQERCFKGLMTLHCDHPGSTHFTKNGCKARIASWVLLAAVALGLPKLSAQTSLVAWGHNGFGQTNVPAAETDAVAISASASGDHTLALRETGEVVAWGANE